MVLADQCLDMAEGIENLILGGYLRGIVSDKNQYKLTHASNIALNEVACHVSAFFSKEISFVDLSRNLATHLYTSTHHPNIASGDLFVILFNKLKVDGEYRSAIGIYKSESKQQYISTHSNGKDRQLEVSSGINPDLIDKGALIIDDSDLVYAIDRLSNRTKYWIEDFLKAKQIANENTKSAIMVSTIEKIRDSIESPFEMQNFCHEISTFFATQDQIFEDEIKSISEKYVSSDLWDAELKRITERKGILNAEKINVPAKNIQTKLKKIFNRIHLGQSIDLMLPEHLSFNGAQIKNDGETIEINITLEKKNG